MKILILTQAVDLDDPVLGFFHDWIKGFAERFDHVSVVCLKKGRFDLPSNVSVFSLGKESGRSKIKYIKNFFSFIFGLHDKYDSVFVHMNQEYVLLGAWFWKILGKKVYMWRNHPRGSLLTVLAIFLCDKVFCTSKYSFTAKFKKTSVMGVGIDTDKFFIKEKNSGSSNKYKKILFLSRMSPIKRPHMLIDALNILHKDGVDFEANFYGEALTKDIDYYNSLKDKVSEHGLNNKVLFHGAVVGDVVCSIYNQHGICVNLTPSGSFDKTIIESMLCGCIPLITNNSLKGEIDDNCITEDNPEAISNKIKFWLNSNPDTISNSVTRLNNYALEKHSLNALMDTLCIEIKG